METRVVFDGRHYRIVNDEHGLASMRQYQNRPRWLELLFYARTWDNGLINEAKGTARLASARRRYAEIHPLLLMKELED